jgi:nucleotide-binding universal stress UspA family protein
VRPRRSLCPGGSNGARLADPNRVIRHQTILVATDFSPLSLKAVHAASDAARLLGAVRLHVVHVKTHESGDDLPRMIEALEVPEGPAAVTRELREGDPAEELAWVAEQVGADLIVSGTHGRSAIGRLLLGSVASNLIRVAPCPVLVVGEGRDRLISIERVLAAVDLSRVSPSVLAEAAAIAWRARAKLEVVSIYEPPITPEAIEIEPSIGRYEARSEDRERAVSTLVSRSVPDGSIDVRLKLGVGQPSKAILAQAVADRASLIVLGTSGHNAIQRMIMGSTATTVVAHAPCPVLVVPHPPRRERAQAKASRRSWLAMT